MSEQTADIRVFPPLASVIAPISAILLQLTLPVAIVPAWGTFWSVAVGILLLALALFLAVSGAKAFRQAATNIDPRKPALILVETGPYRITRNPMYLGMVIFQFGLAFAFSLDWSLICGSVLWAALHLGTVLPEEAYLTARFGAPYQEFMSRTRRWL